MMLKNKYVLQTKIKAHSAGAYPSFGGIRQLAVLLLPPGWDASASQVSLKHSVRFFLDGESNCESPVLHLRTQSVVQVRALARSLHCILGQDTLLSQCLPQTRRIY